MRRARGRLLQALVPWLAAVIGALAVAAPASADPALVSDINPGAASSSPQNFAVVNQTLFFYADDGFHGFELWRSDGTAGGTTLVKDINPAGSASSHVNGDLVNVNGTVFFNATDGTSGFELWKSDGTAAGTTMVKRINSVSVVGSNPLHLTNVSGTLFFTADDGTHGRELWKSDGTDAGTTMVKDINVGGSGSNPTELVNVGGTLFFHADDGVHGDELWTSDGTDAGTTLVKDVNPGGGSSNISEPTNVNGTLFFNAYDGNAYGLWKSDGTPGGTVLVKYVGSVSEHLTNVAGTLFFSADDGNNGRELWKSDGTAAGTVMVKDINAGPGSSIPDQLAAFNGTLFFQATDATNDVELWKSDGTAAGTVMVKDINPGSSGSFPALFTSSGGQLYFSAFEFTHGRELWTTDGTEAGTTLVADINPGTSSSVPGPLADVNGTLFFGATDGTHGDELWTLGAAPAHRSTATNVSCVPGSVAVGQATTCTVIVTDTGNGAPTMPTGNVSFSSGSHGAFGNPGASCALREVSVGQATCHVDYTPSAVDSDTHQITGSYGGDGGHAGSTGNTNLTVTAPGQRPTSTSVSCSPGSVTVASAAACGVTVTDTESGPLITPTGTVALNSDSHGTFANGPSCTLVAVNAATSGCSFAYTPSAVDSGTHTLTATYAGGAALGPSSGRAGITVNPRPPILLPPPVNTDPPVIVPSRSCQFLNTRPFCRTIPYQYVCQPGQWTGINPGFPYQFVWQQLYTNVVSGSSVWRQEATGQTYDATRVPTGPPYEPSGTFRCLVTATGPGGSTVAISPQTHLAVASVSFPLNPPVDIVVTGIEVTQAVQASGCAGCVGLLPSRDQSRTDTPGQATYQGVTLAAGKWTVVRVYANVIGGTPATLSGATAQLEVLDSAGNHLFCTPTNGPSCAITPDSSPSLLTQPTCNYCVTPADVANPASSFDFLIPWEETYHQSLTFRATVTPRRGPFLPGQCSGCGGNTFTLSSVPFVRTATVDIHPVILLNGTTGRGQHCGTPTAHQCTTQSPDQVFDNVDVMLPQTFRVFPYATDTGLSVTGQDSCGAATSVGNFAANDENGTDGLWIGVFYKGEGKMQAGCTLGGGAAVQDIGQPVTSVMHEMGHLLGLRHADTGSPFIVHPAVPSGPPVTLFIGPHPDGTPDCGGNSGGETGENWPPGVPASAQDNEGRLDSFGLDRRAWDIFRTGSLPSTFVEGFDQHGDATAGAKYYDFMSYCGATTDPAATFESVHWISLFNWNRLLTYQAPTEELPAASDLRARPAQGIPLRVTAIVDSNGRTSVFDIAPGQRALGGSTDGSPYRIELRDRAGHLLESAVPLTRSMHVDFSGKRPELMLEATLPFSPAAGSVVVTAAGQELAHRTRSAHAPTAKFLSPRQGTQLGKTRTTVVRWSARDADGDRLTSTVEYSRDGGRHWLVLADGIPGNSARVPSRFLSASRNARLRVLVGDGFDLTTVTSGGLRARGAPPTVQILNAPRRGQVPDTTTLLLQGSAFDDADNAITGRHLKWYLGKRLIGTGERVTLSGPKAGNTVIRLVATDSQGRSAQATLPLRVKAVAARYLLFDAPLLVPSRARTVRITVAASGPATFTIAGRHYAIGTQPRTITVRIRRGKGLLRLPCSLRSAGGVIRETYLAVR